MNTPTYNIDRIDGPQKLYVLYDGRYWTDSDSASVYVTHETMREAIDDIDNWPDDTVIVFSGPTHEEVIDREALPDILAEEELYVATCRAYGEKTGWDYYDYPNTRT